MLVYEYKGDLSRMLDSLDNKISETLSNGGAVFLSGEEWAWERMERRYGLSLAYFLAKYSASKVVWNADKLGQNTAPLIYWQLLPRRD